MMTTECARKLLPLWLKERDTHMGAFFATRIGLEWQHYLGSFYVWPPVGEYWTHPSTTCSSPENPVLLHNHFDHKWSQEGTRPMYREHHQRWICEFSASGLARLLGLEPVRLPEFLPKLCWLTEPPPGTQVWACGLRYYHVGVAPGYKPATEDRLLQQRVFVV